MLRLEAEDTICKIVFYEKSRIKSLIFLTIDLLLTNEKDVIYEMSTYIQELKETNKNLSQQLSLYNAQVHEKDSQLNVALSKNKDLATKFCKVNYTASKRKPFTDFYFKYCRT